MTNPRPVIMDDQIIFESATEAAEYLYGSSNAVRQAATGRMKTYLGHTFSYVSDAPSDMVAIEVVAGCQGPCLLFADARIAGAKPKGGGRVLYRFEVQADILMRELEGFVRQNCRDVGGEDR